MKIKLRFWKRGNTPASDGSIIPDNVFQEYFNSPQYKEMMEAHSCLGALTHRVRDPRSNPVDFQGIKNTTGKDDALLCVSPVMGAPIMYVERMYFEDEWVCADAVIIDENGADQAMSEQIKRLKTLIKNKIYPGVSAVVVAYWDSDSSRGGDVCRKIQFLKGIDITLNPSQKGARVVDVYEDGDDYAEEEVNDKLPAYLRSFSEKDINVMNSGTPVTKLFSAKDIAPDLPKTSKIGLKFTELKVKEFSSVSEAEIIEDTTQKEFTVGTLKERLRYVKLSPRQHFRRLIIDYKAIVKAQGGVSKANPEDLKILKSLFTSDVLMILREIHPEIIKGKQIATLLGASSLGKTTRLAAQKLQIPYKLASKEVEKSGMLSKPRFQKLQDAYTEFINSMIEEVFNDNSATPKPKKEEETVEEETED